MRFFSKIKFNEVKDFVKKLPRILGEHSFLTILTLFFLSLILASLIFYKYVILAEKIETQIIKKPLQFDQNSYQKILDEWQEREKKLRDADLKEYPDLFKGLPTKELTP